MTIADKPREYITVDKQLYGYRGRTRFTQYMPLKPEKYGIKIFWACDANNSYPLNGQIYTGKSGDGIRQTNVGECTVLDLVAKYKNSGLNVTMDNFFMSLQLSHSLNSWNMTLVEKINVFFLLICKHTRRGRFMLLTSHLAMKQRVKQ